MADFDETGLIGREEELRTLRERLLKRRGQVITLTGHGGYGKSSLATQVAWDLVYDREQPFELISWCSMKQEYLSADGIKQISRSVKNLAGAVQELAGAVDGSFEGSAAELGELLSGIRSLLILDNVETVDATEVLAFVDELPPEVTLLLTSRVGLGDGERRLDVGPLDANAAIHLLRLMARARGLSSVAGIPQSEAQRTVDVLNRNPLLLRVFVEAVDSGRDPREVLADQKDELKFCFEAIYSGLTDDAKVLSEILALSDHPVSLADLTTVSGLDSDSTRYGLRELRNRALTEIQADPGDVLANRYSLGDMALAYVRSEHPITDDRASDIVASFDKLRRESERRKTLEKDNFLSPMTVAAPDPAFTAAASKLEEVLRSSRASSADKLISSIASIALIRDEAPTYFEVDRVEAFLRSNREPLVASQLYSDALEKAPTDPYRAKIKYYWAAVLSTRSIDLDRAVGLAREAHETLELPETAQRLARTLMNAGVLEAVDGLLRWALNDERSSDHLKRILMTELTSFANRRLQAHGADEAVGGRWRAIEAAEHSLNEAQDFEATLGADERLQASMGDLASEILGTMSRLPAHDLAEHNRDIAEAADRLSSTDLIGPGTKAQHWANIFLARLAEKSRLAGFELVFGRDIEHTSAGPLGEAKVGVVERFSRAKGYGWLKPVGGGSRLFFHGSEVEPEANQVVLVTGVHVSYAEGKNADGPCAQTVSPDLDEPRTGSSLIGRRAVVAHMEPHGKYAFLTDELTNCSVFMPPKALEGVLWTTIAVGQCLVCNYMLDVDRPIRAIVVAARPAIR